MSDADGASVDDAACTTVLLSAPQQVAERIESFLTANGITCRIKPNTEMRPERLAEEYLKQSPGASGVGKLPVFGPPVRRTMGERLQGIEIQASEVLPVWDVMVRPQDLPPGLRPPTSAAGSDEPTTDVSTAGPVEHVPTMNVPPEVSAPPTKEPASAPEGGIAPVVVSELPWNEAWKLARRLTDAGIPAAVMAPEGPDRDRPMSARIVPVGVRPEDLERARSHLTAGHGTS